MIPPPGSCRAGPATSRRRASRPCPPAGPCRARWASDAVPATTLPPCSARAPGARRGASSEAGATASTLSRAPPIVVWAPGSGVTPRMRAEHGGAGSSQRTRPSSSPSLAAYVGSPCCGCETAEPAAIASTTSESSAAPSSASAESSEPAVASAGTSIASSPKTSPASSSGTSWNTLAPVRASPAMRACCTGAAPRQRGSSEKCRLIHPCFGVDRSGSRTRPP